MPAHIYLALLLSVPAVADEGEFAATVTLSAEVAWIRHPLASQVPAVDLFRPTLGPRAGVGVGFGLANTVEIGAGLEAALAASVVTPGFMIGGVSREIVTGGYYEVALPFHGTFRLDSGDLSPRARLDAGPLIALWGSSVVVDQATLDDAGRPKRLPFDIDDQLVFGGAARIALLAELRFFDAFALAVAPSFRLAWASGWSFTAGLALTPSWMPVLGPL